MDKCTCIFEIEKRLKEELGDPEAELQTGSRFITKDKKIVIQEYIPCTVKYRPTLKNGSFGRRKTKYLIGSYCPFCGEKLEVVDD